MGNRNGDRPSGITLSIVTITMRDDEGLCRTLASIARQIHDDTSIAGAIEVIVVDGAARPETLAIARSTLAERCLWHVLQGPDRGIYDAQNRGLERCAGTYVQFLNGGDAYAPVEQALVRVLAVLQTDRPFWLIVGAEYGGGTHQGRRIANIPHSWWRHALGLQAHCHQACYFRVDYMRAIGGHRIDVGFAADYDLIIKCGIVQRAYEIDERLIRYEGDGVSVGNPRRTYRETMDIRLDRFNAVGTAARIISVALLPRAQVYAFRRVVRRALSEAGVSTKLVSTTRPRLRMPVPHPTTGGLVEPEHC